MIDVPAQRPIRVADAGVGGPFIRVTVDHLPQVRSVLDQHQVRYWVDSQAVSIDNKPAVVIVNLGLRGDAHLVQSALDEAD